MLFNSFVFAGLFLPLLLLLFWFSPAAGTKRAVLLVGSLIFYAYWLPAYLLLLIGYVAIAWACALQAERTSSSWPVWLAGLVLFGGLVIFKYAGFISQIAIDLGVQSDAWRVPQLVLPLGISFIVFQAMGYVIDVHRREFPAEKRFSVVLLFKAFFPQLIAGPICRAHELMPQLRGSFSFKLDHFLCGLAMFAVGLLIKEFFADGLAPLVDVLFGEASTYSFYTAWAAAIGFGGQIYADFWGYSTMAIGLARMFGIDIPVNFRLPYLAVSLREFWRRWHITLSQWLRDYLYKPLGGSRHGSSRTIFALMTTMLVGGLWHGANYTFIIWGAIHGIALVLEHALMPAQSRNTFQSGMPIRRLLGWVYTFLVVFVAWVFFRSADVQQAFSIVSAMFSPSLPDLAALPAEVRQIIFLTALLAFAQVPIEWLLMRLRENNFSTSWATATAFWSFVGAVVLGAPVAMPFIYFQF